MITVMSRGLAAATLAILSLAVTPPARAAETLPLTEAVAALPLAAEDRTGYDRQLFPHWNAGLRRDGCNTRNEVLLTEAIEPPTVGLRCRLTGGMWWSYYDEAEQTDVTDLDIDHMVPLAEAWDSGASAWTTQRRETYANDQGAEASLVAVTDNVNQAKGDQDPAQWLPPAATAHCRYAAEWVATKLRWNLTSDEAEFAALRDLAQACPGQTVTFEPAA